MASLKYRLTHRAIVTMVNRNPDAVSIAALRHLQGPPAPKEPEDVPGVRVTACELDGISGELIVPNGVTDSAPRLLFFHGGGYVASTAGNFRKFVATVCKHAGITAWSMDYRLAPEDPFPAGLDDALRAYRAALDAVGASRLVLGGESAGGGLALATALRAKQEGLQLPRAVLAWWPWTDLTLSGDSVRTNAGKDFLTPSFCRAAAAAYLDGHDAKDPFASPLFGDYTGFPPVFIQAGEKDLIVDDARRLAHVLSAAEVAQTLHVWRHMGHAFATSGDDMRDSRRAVAEAAEWIRSTLNL